MLNRLLMKSSKTFSLARPSCKRSVLYCKMLTFKLPFKMPNIFSNYFLNQMIDIFRYTKDYLDNKEQLAKFWSLTADDSIYSKKKRENALFCGYQQWVCQVSRAKCSVSSLSDRLPFITSSQSFSPAKLNIFIDSAIFLRQLHTALRL